jgi:uncharacterized membrane protein
MESLSTTKNTLLKLSVILLFVIYSYFFWLMLKITLQYLPVSTDVAFLSIKQDYIHLLHYRIAFFIHVFSAVFVLLAGYTQFSGAIRRKYPKVHRRLGWLYAIVTIFLAGPSGFIIGIYANGGLSSQIAFCLLAVLWIVFTVLAVLRIIKKRVASHRIWMIRSFALALSAVTLRAWKYSLVALFHPKPMDVYQVVAWLGWTLNLLIAEMIIFNKLKHGIKNTH